MWKSLRRWDMSDLGDGLDKILVDRDEIGPILVVDHHVGQADEESLLFIDCVGYAIAHGGNEKVAHVDAIYSTDAYANLLAFWHVFLLPWVG